MWASNGAHTPFWRRPGARAVRKCMRGRIGRAWVVVRRQAARARGSGATWSVVGLRRARVRRFGGVRGRVWCVSARAGA